MRIDTALLGLESVLLVFTIVLLIYSIREGRSRDNLIRGVERATKVLSRHEYFLVVLDSMMDAGREISGFITGRLPVGEDEVRAREIEEAIKRAACSGVRVRYMLPRFHDRLHIGLRYGQVGAEVRFSSCPVFHDLRYTLVDSGISIIGIPESTGEREATKKGYRIPSEGLAGVLKAHFDKCWGEASTFDDYMKEVISVTRAGAKQLATELKLEERELEKYF